MATKKQRRRREKERRHEYEYVYIDEEGNEVEVEQPPSSRKERERRTTAASNGRPRPARGMRPVQPPTWRFMRRQAIIFFFILFVAFAILSKSAPIWASALISLAYTALMLPLMWMMQRMMYRSYLRRTGQLPPRERRKK
jgi:Flp pilus assembly protein TadB